MKSRPLNSGNHRGERRPGSTRDGSIRCRRVPAACRIRVELSDGTQREIGQYSNSVVQLVPETRSSTHRHVASEGITVERNQARRAFAREPRVGQLVDMDMADRGQDQGQGVACTGLHARSAVIGCAEPAWLSLARRMETHGDPAITATILMQAGMVPRASGACKSQAASSSLLPFLGARWLGGKKGRHQAPPISQPEGAFQTGCQRCQPRITPFTPPRHVSPNLTSPAPAWCPNHNGDNGHGRCLERGAGKPATRAVFLSRLGFD